MTSPSTNDLERQVSALSGTNDGLAEVNGQQYLLLKLADAAAEAFEAMNANVSFTRNGCCVEDEKYLALQKASKIYQRARATK